MNFYPGSTGAVSYPADTVLDLIAVRESAPLAGQPNRGTFSVYSVGPDNRLTSEFVHVDSTGSSIPHIENGKSVLGFFFDDLRVQREATSSGKIYDLRIWAGTGLTTSQLNTQVIRPDPPSSVNATTSSQSITVNWTEVPGATRYLVNAGTESCEVDAPATACTITGLSDGAQISVSVQAVGNGGFSTFSSSISVTVGQVQTPSQVEATTTVPQTSTTLVSGAAKSTRSLPKTGTSQLSFAFSALLLASGLLIVSLARRRRVN